MAVRLSWRGDTGHSVREHTRRLPTLTNVVSEQNEHRQRHTSQLSNALRDAETVDHAAHNVYWESWTRD